MNEDVSGQKYRGGSRTAATSKMELFVIIVITKSSILDVAAVLDPPLIVVLLLIWSNSS